MREARVRPAAWVAASTDAVGVPVHALRWLATAGALALAAASFVAVRSGPLELETFEGNSLTFELVFFVLLGGLLVGALWVDTRWAWPLLLALAVAPIVAAFASRLSDEPVMRVLTGEISVIELASPLLYGFAALLLGYRFITSGRQNYWIAAFALLFALFAAEEISWGQTYLDYATPSAVESANDQNEFNVHNVGNTEFPVQVLFTLFAAGLVLYLPVAALRRGALVPVLRLTLIPYALALVVSATVWSVNGERADAFRMPLLAIAAILIVIAVAAPYVLRARPVDAILRTLLTSTVVTRRVLIGGALLFAAWVIAGGLFGSLAQVDLTELYPPLVDWGGDTVGLANGNSELLETYVGVLAVMLAFEQFRGRDATSAA